MPLHPVVGRPDALTPAGASLAAHTATRELPTAGPFARVAAAAGTQQDAAGAQANAAPAPAAAADAPAPDAPAIQVAGLTFCYPDIGAHRGEEGRERERENGNG